MLPHPRHPKQLTYGVLGLLVGEQLPDELDRDFRLDSVENSPRVVQRGVLRLPDRTALDEQADGLSPLRDPVARRLVVGAVAVTNAIEVFPPEVSDARFERA